MAKNETSPTNLSPWRERLHEVIFEADTTAGKVFDIALLVAILSSVLVIMLDSVTEIQREYRDALWAAEWIFTILFTIEYGLRLICTRRPLGYVFSFFGVVDLLAVLPTYISVISPESGWYHPVMVIRALRLLRVFRIFKLVHLLSEASALRLALVACRGKITVFLATVVVMVTIMGATMHLVEGDRHGFTSIPQSMYWAVVTMTTVGYGDISPQTALGQALAAVMMVVGYSLIIVPTGILTVELAQASGKPVTTQVCPDCSREGHDLDAAHCKYCGGKL